MALCSFMLGRNFDLSPYLPDPAFPPAVWPVEKTLSAHMGQAAQSFHSARERRLLGITTPDSQLRLFRLFNERRGICCSGPKLQGAANKVHCQDT